MKTFGVFIAEKQFVPTIVKRKKTWGVIRSNSDKEEFSDDLIKTVQTAYAKTELGSFVNTVKDVLPSDWVAIDIDGDPDIDATIFYRKTKHGNKIQGLGHDGSDNTKKASIQKVVSLLKTNGWWIEASDAMEHILYKNNVPYISDEKTAQKIFPNSNLKMTGEKGKYYRKLNNGVTIRESIFGKPK